MNDDNADDGELVYPAELLPLTRGRFPALARLIDEAEMNLPAMRHLSELWRRDHIQPLLPIEPSGQSLMLRVALLGTAMTEQSVQLSESIAREVEHDSLLGAASAARSQLERIGLLAYARDQMIGAVGDPALLGTLTNRLLFASKSLESGHQVFPTGNLIEAAHAQLGGDFRTDYAYLSDLTHPNAPIVWSVSLLEDTAFQHGLTITEERAELFVKIVGQGVHAVAHNAIALIDWAVDNDVFLPSSTSKETDDE